MTLTASLSAFLLSQILATIAIAFDFMSFQYKARKKTYLYLIVSALLICIHYFLLFKIIAGTLVALTALRYIVCYYTTSKKYLVLFMLLNAAATFVLYKTAIDLILFFGSMVFMIGNFQENNRAMRILMMIGTSMYLSYNTIIGSPMAVVLESIFLLSNFVGYYRFYLKGSRRQPV